MSVVRSICLVTQSLSSCCHSNVSRYFLIVFFGLLLSVIYIPTTMATEATKISAANAQFTNGLYKILSKEEGNVFFSPISAHAILSLVYQGAAGETAKSFERALTLPSEKSATAEGYKSVMGALNAVENVALHIANKVYVKDDYKLKESFKTIATKSYFSEVESMNFADSVPSAKAINGWVEDKTNKKIKDLISPDMLDALTRLVLVNAIYFKGDWLNKFDKSSTTTEPFYTSNDQKMDCQMMHITKKYRYAEDEDLDAQLLEMPYVNKNVSMLIILPRARDGIKKLEAKLATTDLSTLSKKLHQAEVEVSLPKFKIETTIDLKPVLEKMGLGVIFSDGADFTGLLDSPEPLKVSKVIQKAFIEVNEEGAEAAAATGMVMMARSLPLIFEFTANQPFVILLQVNDKNVENIFFYGRITRPHV